MHKLSLKPMSPYIDQTKILAFAVYQLRLLLANHLGSSTTAADPAVRAAAHLAYALHNQALSVLEGKPFDTSEALEAIVGVDKLVGENFLQQLAEIAGHAS